MTLGKWRRAPPWRSSGPPSALHSLTALSRCAGKLHPAGFFSCFMRARLVGVSEVLARWWRRWRGGGRTPPPLCRHRRPAAAPPPARRLLPSPPRLVLPLAPLSTACVSSTKDVLSWLNFARPAQLRYEIQSAVGMPWWGWRWSWLDVIGG